MPRIYLSLGSNVDAEANLRLGIASLEARYGELEMSPVYRNKAVGFEGDDFLNLVVGFDSEATVESIAEAIESIHRAAGRDRSQPRYSSRTLDIDLLTWGDAVIDDGSTRLPRADVLEYAFVLKPLADIAAGDTHPVTRRSYGDHWREMSEEPNDLRAVDIRLRPNGDV